MARIPSPTADTLEFELLRLYEKRQALDLVIETLERYAAYDSIGSLEIRELNLAILPAAGLS